MLVFYRNTMQQFSLITQARNSLLAAGQNIEHAARYVPHVKFPYCAPTMMVSLHSACANIYNDARGQQSHQVAAQLHSAFYQEINWLLLWFNKVSLILYIYIYIYVCVCVCVCVCVVLPLNQLNFSWIGYSIQSPMKGHYVKIQNDF